MKNVLAAVAAEQEGVVAVWQLRRAGLGRAAVEHRVRGLRELQPGVYLTGAAQPTRRQQIWAAVLTAPGRVASHATAGHVYGFRPWSGRFEVVTAPGSGGPKRFPSLLVCRVLDAAPRNRPRTLARLAAEYARLPIARAASDPESYALAILAAAKRPLPLVNHAVAGHKPDLAWPHVRLIIELDGPDFHQFPDADLRKQRAWERASWTVERLPTDAVYDAPERLLALSPRGP